MFYSWERDSTSLSFGSHKLFVHDNHKQRSDTHYPQKPWWLERVAQQKQTCNFHNFTFILNVHSVYLPIVISQCLFYNIYYRMFISQCLFSQYFECSQYLFHNGERKWCISENRPIMKNYHSSFEWRFKLIFRK